MTIVAAPAVGTMFGRLEFRSVAEGKMVASGRIVTWLMRCVCGTEKTLTAISVRFGSVKSCGCLRVEVSREHGLASKGRDSAKPCVVCGAKKARTQFGRLRCEWCRAAKHLEARPEKTLEQKLGAARRWRKKYFQDEKNRSNRRAYGREYYRKNKEKYSERSKRYKANRSSEMIAKKKEYAASYYKKNESRSFGNHIKSSYGITVEERERILVLQGGHCAICPRKDSDIKGRRLHVDHCHKTKRVRGLLCTRCNLAIGRMNDNQDRLRRAADYLERSRV